MALPSSGQISMAQLRSELGVFSQSPFALATAAQGGYVAINQDSPSKPSSTAPFTMSSWYGYDHSFSAGPKIYAAGQFGSYNGTTANRIARLNTNGSIDTTFNVGAGFNNNANSAKDQSDKKILVGGGFTTYQGTTANRIVRLNTNGSLDTSFNAGTGPSSNVTTILVQSDQKILIGGFFTTYQGTTANRIARLNTNGSLDTSFSIGTGLNSGFESALIQSDQKIFIAGGFTTYNGTTINRIARLNTNGSLDTSFSVGTGFNAIVHKIIFQPDGKIVAIGGFSSYNGTSINRIARLNTNGSLDTTFNVGTGLNLLSYSLGIQSDGKILAGGAFTTYNGTARNRIVRLNTNGSLDTTFNIGTGFNAEPTEILIQSDGKILVGGFFITYNGTTANRIARLNTDGSLDTSFSIGTGFNSTVSELVIA